MAAPLGFKTFNSGDVLTAADTNGYLMQGVWTFANAAARTAAVTSPQEGNVSFLKDTNSFEIYDGASWVAYGSGDITGVTAGTGISGGGTSGTVTITNSMATEITAAGDIIVGTGSGTFDNLPIGTTGQVLTADTTVSPYKVKWASGGTTFAGAKAYNNSAVTVNNTTETDWAMTAEYFDTDGYHSTSTNTNRFTVPAGKAGKYLVCGTAQFSTNGTGHRNVWLYKNAAVEVNYIAVQNTGAAQRTSVNFSWIVDLAESDYVYLTLYQNSGSSLTVETGSGSNVAFVRLA